MDIYRRSSWQPMNTIRYLIWRSLWKLMDHHISIDVREQADEVLYTQVEDIIEDHLEDMIIREMRNGQR